MKKDSLSVLLTFTIIISALLAGCANNKQQAEEVPLVRWQTIKLSQEEAKTSYPGEVHGRYETKLAFQVGGKISNRLIEVGSTVSDGTVLMTIDTQDISQTLNINAAQVNSALSKLNLAASDLHRYQQLYDGGAISQSQLDQYQNAYDVAEATYKQAQAQYQQGSNQLGYSTLCADSAGVISAITAETGQVVSSGQAVLTLVREGEREIEISVPENRVEDLKQAESMQVTFWALPGITTAGTVREISPIADQISRTYKVRISLFNPPADMNLGMTANVLVSNKQSSLHGVYIPLAAIYQTDGNPGVWVVKQETVTLRPVKLGAFGDNSVQVLAGLQDGDKIVTAGIQKLREGTKVRL